MIWVENIDGWERFSHAHPFLVTMCKRIIYSDDDYPQYNTGWSAKEKHTAMSHLNTFRSFDFIYAWWPYSVRYYTSESQQSNCKVNLRTYLLDVCQIFMHKDLR